MAAHEPWVLVLLGRDGFVIDPKEIRYCYDMESRGQQIDWTEDDMPACLRIVKGEAIPPDNGPREGRMPNPYPTLDVVAEKDFDEFGLNAEDLDLTWAEYSSIVDQHNTLGSIFEHLNDEGGAATFAFDERDQTWTVGIHFGQESPGSDMAAGAAYASGHADPVEALATAARDAGWLP